MQHDVCVDAVQFDGADTVKRCRAGGCIGLSHGDGGINEEGTHFGTVRESR